MGELYEIAQRHMDAYGVRAAALARRMQMPPQTLNAWKIRGVKALPAKPHLEALANETRTPYGDVLLAALRDAGYLEKAGEEHERSAPKDEAGGAPAGASTTASHLTDEELPREASQPPKPDTDETDQP